MALEICRCFTLCLRGNVEAVLASNQSKKASFLRTVPSRESYSLMVKIFFCPYQHLKCLWNTPNFLFRGYRAPQGVPCSFPCVKLALREDYIY